MISSFSCFELKAAGDGMLLKLTHRWLSVRNASGFKPGWQAFLDRLAAQLAKAPIPNWEKHYAELSQVSGWEP